MKHSILAGAVSVLMYATTLPVAAGPVAANAGVQRATNGATDAATSPVRLVEGISQDVAAHGAIGVVTGTVKGGARAAAQLVTGAANVGVGIIETIVSPFHRD